MLKNLLFASAFISTAIAFPGQFRIKDSNVFSPKELGLVSLTHDDSGFYVIHNGVKRSVKSHNVDKELRNRPSHKIEKFLQHGYISVNKMSDGDFVLNSKVRGNGGGVLLGQFLYGLTKGACYTGLIAGSATVVAAAAPVIGGAVIAAGGSATAATLASGVPVAVGKVAIGTMMSTAAVGAPALVSTTVVGAGAGLAATVVGTEFAAAATVATAMGTPAGYAGAAVMIEVASVAAGAFGTSILWLP